MTAASGFSIADWLAGLGPELATYAGAFQANDIGAAVLPMLSADDLKELGVASIGHRLMILAAAKAIGPAVPVAIIGERRLLSVMFCDLVNSTALSVASEAEDYVDFIQQFRKMVETAIRPFGGTIATLMGDGVMACFGFPTASDHDAERAVAAGLAILEAASGLPKFGPVPPQVRIGIATGTAVVGQDDGSGGVDLSAVGETPNLAARIQALAEPGTMVIAGQTRTLIGDVFDCTDLGTPAMKGIADPVQVWKVTGRSATISRFEALRVGANQSEFVGRSAERQALAAHLAHGAAQPVVVTGDPGIGKSRLIRQALAEAGLDRPLILQCSPYHSGLALHPIRYLLIQRTGMAAGQGQQDALIRLQDLLAEVGLADDVALALVAGFLGLMPEDAGAVRGLGSATLRRQLLHRLAALVQALARQAGVLVLEDAHWLDPSSAEVMQVVCDGLALDTPVIWTARPQELPGWQSDLPVLALDRLPPEEVMALMAGLAGQRQMPVQVAQTIATRSDGVPIYAEELTRGWLASRGGDVHLPVTLSETLLARLDRLVHGRRIAAVAAAIGREFPLDLLVAVCDMPANVTLSGVSELLSAEVLVPGQSQFGAAIRFRHNLVREAAYDTILRRQRAALHSRIADVIEADYPVIAQALPHIMAAQRGLAGQPAKAAAEWERAGREASQRSAYAEAAGFLAQAIAANSQTPSGPDHSRKELDLRVSALGVVICLHGYQSPEAAAETAQITRLADNLGDAAGLLPAMQARWVQLGSSNAVQAALDFAYRIRETLANGAVTDQLIATRMCATSLLFVGDLGRALVEYHAFMDQYDPQAHGAAMRTGHSDHATMVLLGLAETYTLMGNEAQSTLWRSRTLATARASGRVHDRCHTLAFAGCFHALLMRRWDEAQAAIDEMSDLLATHSLPNWAGYLDLFQGLVLVQGGDGAKGLALARQGIEALMSARAFGNWWYILFAEACIATGATAEAERMLALAETVFDLAEWRFAPECLRLQAQLDLRRGDDAAALAKLTSARTLAEKQQALLHLGLIDQDIAALLVQDMA